MSSRFAIAFLVCASLPALAETEFPAVTQWKTALASAALSIDSLYSTNPPAQTVGKDKQPHPIAEELDFWKKLKASGLRDLSVFQHESGDQQGMHAVSLTISFHTRTPQGLRTRYVLEDQMWQQQAGAWRIVMTRHSAVVKMPRPTKLNPNLYPPNVDAKEEIKEAIARAGKEHKRVILVFGANWCYDCHVLDYALHQPDLSKIADASFLVVHVDIGEGKLNNDVAATYEVPLDRGVPALAVLASDGKLLYSQKNGEFEAARSMDPDDLITFLNKWKP